ncbi:MAG: ABC-type transporter, periplasmic subunit [Firmicutes bacterium]|nr:ABC-type transporter, periplasmic subunit [Bacillota bacterium]
MRLLLLMRCCIYQAVKCEVRIYSHKWGSMELVIGETGVNSMRKFGILILCLLLAFLLPGCGSNSAPGSNQGSIYMTITDDAGRTVVLPKKPQRIVVLSTSELELLYAVGGQAIGRASTKAETIPLPAVNLPEVGFVYNVNMEKLLALQPDLVIAHQGMHEKLIPVLESSNIPVLVVKMKKYEDIVAKATLFGEISGNTEKAEALIHDIEAKINAVQVKLPQKETKFAILHATAKNVTVELDSSVAGSTAKMLNLKNIASGDATLQKDLDAIPYSLEKLVAGDPDVIFVVTMGQPDEIEKRMKADVESNPAWNGLRAVKEKRMYFLPSELFLLNPGLHIDESAAYMAKLVYPEVYGNVQ